MRLESLIDSDEWDNEVMKNDLKIIAILHSISAVYLILVIKTSHEHYVKTVFFFRYFFDILGAEVMEILKMAANVDTIFDFWEKDI